MRIANGYKMSTKYRESLFRFRKAVKADIPALHTFIALSVRGLQANDYTPRQIEGALGTLLGVDTLLIADGTYLCIFGQSKDAFAMGKTISIAVFYDSFFTE